MGQGRTSRPSLAWTSLSPLAAVTTALSELTEHGPEAFPGIGHQTAQEEEVRRLKRELEVVKQERDILKKAISIFSRERQ